MFTTERGGYAVTSDSALAARLRDVQATCAFASARQERAALLRWCYRAAWAGEPQLSPRIRCAEVIARSLHVPGVRAVLDYEQQEYDDAVAGRFIDPYPTRLPNLMAYAGLRQLKRFDEELAHRRRLAGYLETELPALGARVARYDRTRAEPSWVRFPFVVEDRASWAAWADRSGLAPGNWMADPIHPRGSNWEISGYRRGQCPNGEHLSRNVLNVPVHSRVSRLRLEDWIRLVRRSQRSGGVAWG
jgi:dTDP-4-amino-4,6-dideoxygalactose transaminase